MLPLLIFGFLTLPVIFLGRIWFSIYSGQKTATDVAVALLSSASFGYLWAALRFRLLLLGPDYSDPLYHTIQAHLALMFVLFGISIFGHSRMRSLLAVATLFVGVAWFYVLVVNSIV